MQGVIKSYDPGTGDGVVMCDTDLSEYDLAGDALVGLGLPHAPPGPAGHLRPRRRGAGHAPAARLRGRHGHPGVRRPTAATPEPTDVGGPITATASHRRERPRRPRTRRAARTGSTRPPALCEPDRRRLVRRLRRGVRPPLRSCSSTAARSSALDRGQAAQQLPRPVRPRRRRPGRGPHLHLLRPTRSTPAPPTTGATPAEMKDELLGLFRGACGAARCTWCRSRWARSARPSPTSACSSPTRPTSP